MHAVMVIATYHVATIPHDWHTTVRSRSSKVNNFNVIWKPVFDFLLVINSNLSPILHHLATIHRYRVRQMTTNDNRVRRLQHCCSASIISVKGLGLGLLSLALRCPRGQILSPWPWDSSSWPWFWLTSRWSCNTLICQTYSPLLYSYKSLPLQ